jgi:hypothetical protein
MTLKVPADNERKGKKERERKKFQLRISEPLTKLFQNEFKSPGENYNRKYNF